MNAQILESMEFTVFMTVARVIDADVGYPQIWYIFVRTNDL